MSSGSTRQRLIRAVRLLPGTVRLSGGVMEEIPPEGGEAKIAAKDDKADRTALEIAEAEVKKLRSELKFSEENLSAAREECKGLRLSVESEREALDRERNEFRANSAREADEAREAARAEGREQGHAAGHSEGLVKAETQLRREYEEKFSHALNLLGEMAGSLSAARERLASAHSSQLVRLWETMLRRMLAAKVEIDPQAAQRVVGDLLKRLSDRERIIVYLNPRDVEMIEGSKESLIDSIRGVKFFELLSDDHVDKGSCLIETNLGIYDARWRTQLEQVSSEVQSLLLECAAADESDGSS